MSSFQNLQFDTADAEIDVGRFRFLTDQDPAAQGAQLHLLYDLSINPYLLGLLL